MPIDWSLLTKGVNLRANLKEHDSNIEHTVRVTVDCQWSILQQHVYQYSHWLDGHWFLMNTYQSEYQYTLLGYRYRTIDGKWLMISISDHLRSLDFPWRTTISINRYTTDWLSWFSMSKLYSNINMFYRLEYIFSSIYSLKSGWWFGTWISIFHILGISSSQLTFIFFRGVA